MHQVNEKQFREYNNTGTLWKNHKKEQEGDRDCNGDAVIDGVQYYVSGWTRKKKNGEKYVRLFFSKKKVQHPENITERPPKDAETVRAEHSAA